jgi:hypothetical protein
MLLQTTLQQLVCLLKRLPVSLQVDGERDPVLEEPMLLRQQLEGSALPNEFKRAPFISPAWDEILLDVNRTIQVTKGGKVSAALHHGRCFTAFSATALQMHVCGGVTNDLQRSKHGVQISLQHSSWCVPAQ